MPSVEHKHYEDRKYWRSLNQLEDSPAYRAFLEGEFPEGSEVVICTGGEMTLVQEIGGERVRTTIQAGEYAINAPGVWHTADIEERATVVFITAGEGTQGRPR